MKKKLLFIALVMMTAFAASAQNKMTVTLKNGSELNLFVSEIERMTWSTDSTGGGGNDPSEQTVTGDATDVTSYSATVTCYANNIFESLATDLKIGVIYCTSGTPSWLNGTQVTVSRSSIGADGKYTVNLTNLTESTTYYYRSFVYQSGLWFYGKTKSFTTKDLQAGVNFMTGAATSVTCFSAQVAAQMTIDATSDYNNLSYGIAYDTIAAPTKQQTVTSRDASGSYTTTLRALMGNTIYYYRPYAVIDGATFYGPVSSFKTLADNVVTTGEMDENYNVKSKLTINGGAFRTLSLGLCWSSKNAEPTTSDNSSTVNEVDAENCYTLNIHGYGTIYYRAYVLIDGIVHYGAVKSIERKFFDPSVDTKEYVDLGLSVKWATCNIGASSPEMYGDYFSWGETTPKSGYDWLTYKYCNGTYNTMTKYCSSRSLGIVDYKITLEAADDAATANWGGDWRVPTDAELWELCTNCTWTWTNQNGVNGYKVTGTNGNFIFLPAAGQCYNVKLDGAGSYGIYWTSSLGGGGSSNAFVLSFASNFVADDGGRGRCYGLSVRPVCQ